jgi:hypothetical protein
MFAGERPEELVMPVRQRLVAGAAIAGAVQCQRALVDNGAVTGWRPRLDLPGHGLARVESEGIKVKDTYMRLITRVGHWSSGIADLDRAVVTLLGRRGLAVARGGRNRLRARAGRPERQGQLVATSAAPAAAKVKLARRETVDTRNLRCCRNLGNLERNAGERVSVTPISCQPHTRDEYATASVPPCPRHRLSTHAKSWSSRSWWPDTTSRRGPGGRRY